MSNAKIYALEAVRHTKTYAPVAVRYLELFNNWLVVGVGLLIMALMTVIVYNLAADQFFSSPSVWVPEYSKHAVPFLVFLPLAYAQQLGQHIRVDIVTSRLSGRKMHIITLIALALSLFYFIIVSYSMAAEAGDVLSTGRMNDNVACEFNLFPIFVIAPIGCILMSLQLFIDIIRRIVAIFPGESGQGEPAPASGGVLREELYKHEEGN
ncbi:TRAP transporter small permease subunit [Chloroflexota bacterium]